MYYEKVEKNSVLMLAKKPFGNYIFSILESKRQKESLTICELNQNELNQFSECLFKRINFTKDTFSAKSHENNYVISYKKEKTEKIACVLSQSDAKELCDEIQSEIERIKLKSR